MTAADAGAAHPERATDGGAQPKHTAENTAHRERTADGAAHPERVTDGGAHPVRTAARFSRRTWLAAWAVLALTVAFAAWGLVAYLSVSSDSGLAFGRERDAALSAGSAEVADLNTVSVAQVGTWESRWLADTTGVEHARIAASNAAAKAQILRVRTSSAATVTGAAVTSLNAQSGTAQLIAVVRVQQTADSGGASTITNRYLVVLTLTSQGWKISSLTPQ